MSSTRIGDRWHTLFLKNSFFICYYLLFLDFKSAEDAFLQVRSEVEALLRRLVVGHILSGDADAVYGVFKEGVEAVLGRDGRYVEAQSRVVLCTQEDLFAPVAQDVGVQTRIALATIVAYSLECCQFFTLLAFPIVFRDAVSVEQFA